MGKKNIYVIKPPVDENGIPQSDITYYVNEEKRTVVAKVCGGYMYTENCHFRHTGLLKDEIKVNDIIRTFGFNEPTEYYGQTVDGYVISRSKLNFEGKAVCSLEDEFDLETGKRIARTRALKKYYKYRLNMYCKAAAYLLEQLDMVEDNVNYSWRKAADLQQANNKF